MGAMSGPHLVISVSSDVVSVLILSTGAKSQITEKKSKYGTTRMKDDELLSMSIPTAGLTWCIPD